MNRWRLVETQNGGPEHIHSVVLSEDEAREALLLEASMHERGGWLVTVGINIDGEPDVVIARRLRSARKPGPVERIVTVREYDPLEDVGSWL
jgi:hypothetical protein